MRTVANRLLVAGFVVGIVLPAAFGLTRPDGDLAGEARRLAPWPEFHLKRRVLTEFPGKFEAAFTDRLAGRGALVSADAAVKAGWLGMSPSPQVTLGRDGWLFLDAEGWRTVNLPGVKRAEACEQAAMWAKAIRERRDWLARRGIRYLVVRVPEKDHVYPDLVPPAGRRHGPTPTDLLLAELGRDGTTAVLDLRPILQREATARPGLYFHTDTHWTTYGASVASRAVMEEVRRRWLPALDAGPCDGSLSAGPPVTRDLTRLLGLDGPGESDVVFVPSDGRLGASTGELLPLRADLKSPAHIPADVWTGGPADAPRLVMFHDSFGELMRPFLAARFSRAGFAPTPWLDPAVVDRVQPHVVVQAIVDRITDHCGGANVPEMGR